MAVDYTPTLGDYKELKPFRYWCQKVLPLVYDDSLSYYELLCKVVDYLNKTMEDVDTLHDDVTDLHDAYVQLQTYVNDYFDDLDVQEEINNKLDEMAEDGSLSDLIEPFLPDIISEWLTEHITPTTPAIDNTLSVSGAGADAKVTGDMFKRATLTTNLAVTSSNASEYPDVDLFPNRSIINVMASANILHKPFESFVVITTGWNNTDTAPYGGSKQIAISNLDGAIATRSHSGTAWSTWFNLASYLPTVATLSSNINVTSSNASQYPDVDNFPNRTIINVGSSANILHKPFDSFTVITTGYNRTDTTPYGGSKQIAINNVNGAVATRSHSGTSWSSWYDVGSYISTVATLSSDVIVNSSNASSYPDVDSFPNRSIFFVGSSANILNKPFESFTVITTGYSRTNVTPHGGSKQIAFNNNDGAVATRSYNGTNWSPWVYNIKQIYATPSNFIEQLDFAYTTGNCEVIMASGDYYLFDSTHNETYWKNKRPATRYCGILLGNNVRIKSDGTANLIANYNGNDEDIKENFSIFNIVSSCEVSGVNLFGTNICYLIHDDSPIVDRYASRFVLNGCKLIHSGTDHTFTSGAPMCIGCGEGNNSYREFISNIFSSTYDRSVNVHTATGGSGRYIIKDNYFIAGTLGFTKYGDGTGVLEGIVSGNSLPSDIVNTSQGGATPYLINNVIR